MVLLIWESEIENGEEARMWIEIHRDREGEREWESEGEYAWDARDESSKLNAKANEKVKEREIEKDGTLLTVLLK